MAASGTTSKRSRGSSGKKCVSFDETVPEDKLSKRFHSETDASMKNIKEQTRAKIQEEGSCSASDILIMEEECKVEVKVDDVRSVESDSSCEKEEGAAA